MPVCGYVYFWNERCNLLSGKIRKHGIEKKKKKSQQGYGVMKLVPGSIKCEKDRLLWEYITEMKTKSFGGMGMWTGGM